MLVRDKCIIEKIGKVINENDTMLRGENYAKDILKTKNNKMCIVAGNNSLNEASNSIPKCNENIIIRH